MFENYGKNIYEEYSTWRIDLKAGLLGIAGATAFGGVFGVLGYMGLQGMEARGAFIGMLIFTEAIAGVVLYQATQNIFNALKKKKKEEREKIQQKKEERKAGLEEKVG